MAQVQSLVGGTEILQDVWHGLIIHTHTPNLCLSPQDLVNSQFSFSKYFFLPYQGEKLRPPRKISFNIPTPPPSFPSVSENEWSLLFFKSQTLPPLSASTIIFSLFSFNHTFSIEGFFPQFICSSLPFNQKAPDLWNALMSATFFKVHALK